MNKPNQIPTGKAATKVLSTAHVNAMEKALDEMNEIKYVFAIKRTTDTLVATHKPSNGKEVLRAIRQSDGLWLIRHHKKLFV
tara:strand:- start:5228 stop:5473 length:246 start_codon:yes stop_codon:yes gene_type:complete